MPPTLVATTEGADASLTPLVTALYEAAGLQPLWTSPEAPLARTSELLTMLDVADIDGLDPADYDPRGLRGIVDEAYAGTSTEARRFAVDRRLTEAFLAYALDLSRGRVDPDKLGWHIHNGTAPIDALLVDAVQRNDLAGLRARLAPVAPAYEALRQHLRRYRELAAAGGWSTVPAGPKLEPGDRAPVERLLALERRLAAEGDLDGTDDTLARAARQAAETGLTAEAVYDTRLENGVRAFQQRHGIGVDGVVGPATSRELNVPVERRVRQIELNMERWRWMPRTLEARRAMVNIPAFTLTLYDHDRPEQSMAVVVGRRTWQTPIFADSIEYIVLNPYWNVPKNIARDELLPKLRRDASFLEREGYELTDVQGNILEPTEEEISRATYKTHFLRQLPGGGNALGQMKFLFPNHWDVYLHDTPSRSLFARAERSFSHGCIRVQRPVDLAEFLIRNDSQWSMERLEKLRKRGPDKWMRLETPTPIYITYFTATVADDGSLRFHPDLYYRDDELDRALRQEHNPPGTALVASEPPRTAHP